MGSHGFKWKKFMHIYGVKIFFSANIMKSTLISCINMAQNQTEWMLPNSTILYSYLGSSWTRGSHTNAVQRSQVLSSTQAEDGDVSFDSSIN